MPKPSVLFDAKSVEWLKVTTTRLAEGKNADVYLGKIKFRGRHPSKVGVKVYRTPQGKYVFDETRELLTAFCKAGVRIPKMGIFEHRGTPVLVSSAYVKAGKTKLSELSELEPDFDYNAHPSFTVEVARQLGRMARAHWTPGYVVEDVIHLLQTERGPQPVIVDVEPYHFERLRIKKVAGRLQYEGEIPMTKEGFEFPIALNAIHEFFLKISNPKLQDEAFKQFHAQLTPIQAKAFLHQLDPRNEKQNTTLEKAIKYWREYYDQAAHLKVRQYNRVISALDAGTG